MSALKYEIEKLTKRNQEFEDAASNSERFDQLSQSLEDVVNRLGIIEQEQMEHKKVETTSGDIPKTVMHESDKKKKEAENCAKQ